MKISLLLSLLTGCSTKPENPGTSAKIQYPVLLIGDRRMAFKEDEERLTTTTFATGLNFPEYTLLDSAGELFEISDVTSFEKEPAFFSMGTAKYRVFLKMRSKGRMSLPKAKAYVQQAAKRWVEKQDSVAWEAISGANSLPELIVACSRSWEW